MKTIIDGRFYPKLERENKAYENSAIANLRHYLRIFLEGMRKSKKNFRQASRSPGRDLKPDLPNMNSEYYYLSVC
jgi:hypothetical protein